MAPMIPIFEAAVLAQLAVAEALHVRTLAAAKVGSKQREVRFRHAFKKDVLAEIELVVAGHEDIGRHHIGQRHQVGALVETAEQTRR